MIHRRWTVFALSAAVLASGDGAGNAAAVTEDLIAAEKLTGTAVEAPDGRGLGHIEELLLDMGTNRVSYAVLRNEERDLAIGWPVLRSAWRQGTIVLAPGDSSESVFEDPNRVFATGEDAARPGVAHWDRRLSELIGRAVRNARGGDDLGDLESILVDPREGRIVYGVVESGGFLGLSGETLLAPWRVFEYDAWKSHLTIHASGTQLEAASHDEAELPDLADVATARQLHELFDLRPYWEVWGYTVDDVGEGERDPLAAAYDARHARTVRGRITSVGTYYPERGPGLVRLRIATAEREPDTVETVYVAPWWFCRERNVRFVHGTELEVSGAVATVDGREVLLARELGMGTWTLTVRDEKGRPGWTRRTP